ncbi:hypothetical protein B0H66DRAFT_7269 [Apodospora peruviana]|uniref:Uncharacterized protein n=1 Tax=Apodospora peruviana TaxID=516989 RepID=A0AAE0IPT1_9PEZI|nr:hypothetical protein B0H66DRAFT_7269 [Apodospora peruviana]
MPGSLDPGLGAGDLLSKPWASPESSMEALPSRGKRSVTPTTKPTPKGHKFTNLDEAHQAITSRLAPRSASNNSNPLTPSLGSSGSVASSVDAFSSTRPSDRVPTAQHMELARANHPVNGRNLTLPYAPTSPTTGHGGHPLSSLSPQPSDATSAFPGGFGIATDNTDQSVGNKDSSASRAPRETGSTVENIYKQYLPSESSSSAAGFKAIASGEAASCPKSPATSVHDDGNDANYRLGGSENLQSPRIKKMAGGLDSGKNRWQLYFSPSTAPEVPLPELPSVQNATQQSAGETSSNQAQHSSTEQSVMSISDSRALLNGAGEGSRDFESNPPATKHASLNGLGLLPTRGQSFKNRMTIDGVGSVGSFSGLPMNSAQHILFRDRQNHASFMSQTGLPSAGFSTGGLTSDSDDDPFRYDRGSYNMFLQPSREREISVALHRVSSGTAPESKGELYSPSPSPPPLFVPPPGPSLPVQGATEISNEIPKSTNPFRNKPNLQFYQTSVVNHAWDAESEPNQIKISVQPSRIHTPQIPQVNQPVGLSLGEHLHDLKNERSGGMGANILSEGGDWETVGTEVGQFDSNRACASGTGFTGSRVIKTTGSSIADYSDDGRFIPASFSDETFISSDRILQHPMPGNASNSQHLRTLKDTGRPIFLPKARIHRVNGYPQDSIRTFTAASGYSGSSVSRYLAEKFSNPLRSNSFAKRRQNWANPYENLEGSKFDFRDSRGSANSVAFQPTSAAPTDMRREKPGLNAELTTEPKPVVKIAIDTAKAKQSRYARTNQQPPKTPVPDESFTTGQEKSYLQSEGSLGPESPVQFSFPLIPLHEAARREALRRASGEDLSFVSNTTRTRMNSSFISSKATQKSTPPTPFGLVTKPLPVHARRPITPFGDPEEPGGLSISSTPPAPGRTVFPRSCRNPFSSIHDSVRSSSTFQAPVSAYSPPHLWPRDRRGYLRRHSANSDPEIRDLADMNFASAFGIPSEDASLSWEARRRRQFYYYLICVLCILPFFAVLAYFGAFDSALSWLTKGETGRLNRRQRRNILVLAVVISVLWFCVVVVVATIVATRGKNIPL